MTSLETPKRYCTASWIYIEDGRLVDLSCSLPEGHEPGHYDISSREWWAE